MLFGVPRHHGNGQWLDKVMLRLKEYDCHLPPDKCKCEPIKFIGFVLPVAGNGIWRPREDRPTPCTKGYSSTETIFGNGESLQQGCAIYPSFTSPIEWITYVRCWLTLFGAMSAVSWKTEVATEIQYAAYTLQLEIGNGVGNWDLGLRNWCGHFIMLLGWLCKAVLHVEGSQSWRKEFNQIREEAMVIVINVQRFHTILYALKFNHYLPSLNQEWASQDTLQVDSSYEQPSA